MIRGRLIRQLLPILVSLGLSLTAASAVQQPKQAPQQKPQEVTVYITRAGARYHKTTCGYLARSKIAISLKDAKEKGYTPCKVCKPPDQGGRSQLDTRLFLSGACSCR